MYIGTYLFKVQGGSVAEWFRALVCKIWSSLVWRAYRYLDLRSVDPRSIPRLCCVNSQLVSLPLVWILNSLCSI